MVTTDEKDELKRAHDAKLKEEQEEVARLKAELAQLKESHQSEIKKLTEDNAHLEKRLIDSRAFGSNKEKELLSVRDEHLKLQGKIKSYLTELNRLQAEMKGKLDLVNYCAEFYSKTLVYRSDFSSLVHCCRYISRIGGAC